MVRQFSPEKEEILSRIDIIEKEYPEEKVRSMGTLQYDGDNDTPYARANKKIGRNDPCPCGRGKKYKQCCGR